MSVSTFRRLFLLLALCACPAWGWLDVPLCGAGTRKDFVDIGNTTSESGRGLRGWSQANIAGGYGGCQDGAVCSYRQVIEPICSPLDYNRSAWVNFTLPANFELAEISVRHLDGAGQNDQFSLSVDGTIEMIFSNDNNAGEVWKVLTATPANTYGTGTHELKFYSLTGIWANCNQYGQVSIDWVQICAHDTTSTSTSSSPTTGARSGSTTGLTTGLRTETTGLTTGLGMTTNPRESGSPPQEASDSEPDNASEFGLMLGLVLGGVCCCCLFLLFGGGLFWRQRESKELVELEPEMEPDHYSGVSLAFSSPGYTSLPESESTSVGTANRISESIALDSHRGESSRQWMINASELKIGDVLGAGAYGVVAKAWYRNQEVAAKTLKTGQMDSQQLEEFMDEARILSSIPPHNNIVAFFGVSLNPPEAPVIVTKFYERGALRDYLRPDTSRDPITWRLFFRVAKGVAAGLAHLHREKVVHRDVATRNVLISENLDPVVADFGYSRVLPSAAGGDQSDEGSTSSDVGPVRWMAVECISKRSYSAKSDVWAFATLLWETFAIPRGLGRPFPELDNIAVIASVLGGARPLIPPVIGQIVPRPVEETLAKCWLAEPVERPSCQELFETFCKLEIGECSSLLSAIV